MNKLTLVSAGLLALAAGFFACNVHDNTLNATAIIPNATLNVTADTDVNNVMPSQAVPVTITVTNVFLVDPMATPPPEHEMDAGHLEFHLDDETTPPLLVTAQTEVQVPIPAETKAGPHKIICRLHKHDGTPTTTVFEVQITVKVTVTTTGAGGSSGSDGAAGAAGGDGAAGATGTTDAAADAGADVGGSVDASVAD